MVDTLVAAEVARPALTCERGMFWVRGFEISVTEREAPTPGRKPCPGEVWLVLHRTLYLSPRLGSRPPSR